MKNFVGTYDVQVNLDLVRKVEAAVGGIIVTYSNGDAETFAPDSEDPAAMHFIKEVRDALRK
jgi:hypothetical protein